MMTSSPCFQLAGWRPGVCGELHGVEDAEDLVKVAAGGHRITELQLYLLVRADDEDGADGGVGGRGAAFVGAGLVGGEHVVELWRP